MRGVMPSASATFWPYMNWCAEVGTFNEDGIDHRLSYARVGQRVAAGLHVHGHGSPVRSFAEGRVADAGMT